MTANIKGKYFRILDHGFISLVDHMGSDIDIEQAARVSYGKGTRKTSETRGLIRTLMRERHTSPIEMVETKWHVRMPIFVARQWIRHRTANVNEYSGRYSVMPMRFYMPAEGDLCSQSKSNKQGRALPVSPLTYEQVRSKLESHREGVRQDYEYMLEEDVARELARMDLPLSTYTEWFWKIDLHNLLHFLWLRCDDHAQYEIRTYADCMAAIIKELAPLTFEAWLDYSFDAISFSYQEQQILANSMLGKQLNYAGAGSDLSPRERDNFNKKLEKLGQRRKHFSLEQYQEIDMSDI